VVDWSDPQGSRNHIGALLLGYFTPGGELIYAGRVGTGMTIGELKRLHARLRSLGCIRCRCRNRHRALAGLDRRSKSCPLGVVRNGCRGQRRRDDARRSAAARQLSRRTRGQAGGRRGAAGSADLTTLTSSIDRLLILPRFGGHRC
jgi:hypothetical protein